MTRNLRAIVRALKRVRPRKKAQRHVVDYRVCKLMIGGRTIALARMEPFHVALIDLTDADKNPGLVGFTSTIYDTDYPGAFTELTFGSRRL